MAPPHGMPPPPPRKSNIPIVAVILAVALLLCGGTAVAGVLIARKVSDAADKATEPFKNLPTQVPALPTELPTDLPNVPGAPDDLPDLPGLSGRTVTIVYEVTGDGPADIAYLEKLGDPPKRIQDAKLPWRLEASVPVPALFSVVALRTSSAGGSINCTATIDGAVAAENTRDGSYATATCTKFLLN
jgi:hypothetical protein